MKQKLILHGMTIQQAIEKAIEGGYSPSDETNYEILTDPFGRVTLSYFSLEYPDEGRDEYEQSEVLLSRSFWQCLGKAMGWDGWHYFYRKTVKMETWRWHWHRLIDHLAEGKDITSFFEQL